MKKKWILFLAGIIIAVAAGCRNNYGGFYPPVKPPVSEGSVVAVNLMTPEKFSGMDPVSFSSINVEGDINTQDVIDDTVFAFFTWFCPLFSNFETVSGSSSSRDYTLFDEHIELETSIDYRGHMITAGKSDSIQFVFDYDPEKRIFDFVQAFEFEMNLSKNGAPIGKQQRLHVTRGKGLEIQPDGTINGDILIGFVQGDEFTIVNANFYSDSNITGSIALDHIGIVPSDYSHDIQEKIESVTSDLSSTETIAELLDTEEIQKKLSSVNDEYDQVGRTGPWYHVLHYDKDSKRMTVEDLGNVVGGWSDRAASLSKINELSSGRWNLDDKYYPSES